VWPHGSEFIGDADDWLRVAFTHEFTHIVHLDRSDGWARVVRGIFGRTTVAFPNLFLPTWQIEGLAVYEESIVTGEGRLHAGDFAAVVGEAARGHALEPLDRVNGGLSDWPDGDAPYAYGVGFHDYLAKRFGADALGALARDTARRLPYTGSRAFLHVYGESLGDLWRDYEAEATEASLDTTPQTPAAPTQITRQGFVVTGPRFDRAAPREVLYASQTADEFPSLYRIDIDSRRPQKLTTQYLGTTATAGRRAIYFDQLEVRRNTGTYSDLYSLTPSSAHVAAVTRDARLLEPDLSPDETTVAAVQNRPGGRDVVLVHVNPAARQDPGASPPRIEILASEPETRFDVPRWSHDGRHIAVERHRLGSLSEIVVIDLATRAVRTVASRAGSRIVTPAWTPDDRACVAAVAAENEPFNLYEFPVDRSAPPRPLTSLTGGATWPDVSADGRTIVFVGYTTAGFDLFTMEYPVGSAGPMRGAPPTGDGRWSPPGEGVPQLNPPGPSNGTLTAPYSPLPTLPPTSWSPLVETSPSQVRAGATVAGGDVLGYHLYSATATWLVSGPSDAIAPPACTPDWLLSYVYNRWRPALFATASSQTTFFAGPPAANGTPTDSTLRERQLQVGLLVPILHARVSHTALVSEVRSVDDYTLPDQAIARTRTASRAAWATTTAHSYAYSISPERGITAGATVEVVRRAFGSSADATIATADVREYVPGLADHHVLALRAAGGVSNGDPTIGRTFLLGGSVPDLGVISFSSSAVSLLRGFPANTFAGSRVAVVNADYRFPIARPERGYGTWPLFLHTIHGAVFADAGQAWTGPFHASDIKTSAGAELSANVVAGYVVPFTLSVGAAWGHDGSGIVGDGVTAYARIGKAF